GKCGICRQQERIESGDLKVKKYSIKAITPKRKEQKSKERGCLGAFFEFHLTNLEKNPKSEESGTFIDEPTTANIAHLLPKRKQGGFPSVQCHLDNCVYLTLSEHTRFDKLLDERDYKKLEQEFPNSWEIVCQRLRKLLNIALERNKMYFSLIEYLDEKEKTKNKESI
ncbi:MAG: hypothetical protein ABFD07_10065, partial [Methanobacterium sp.]